MKNKILSTIVHVTQYLSPILQKQVLVYVQNLKEGHTPGSGGIGLLDFAGSIPAEELKIMGEATEKDSARIDLDEWQLAYRR